MFRPQQTSQSLQCFGSYLTGLPTEVRPIQNWGYAVSKALILIVTVLLSVSAHADTSCFVSQSGWDPQVGDKYGRKDALMKFNPASFNEDGHVQRFMYTSELLAAFTNLETMVKTGACKADHSLTRQFHNQVCDCSIETSSESLSELMFHVKYCDTGFGAGEFTPYLAYNTNAEQATKTLGVAKTIGICK